MTVELKVKHSGSWRTIIQPEVKSGGVWRTVTTVEVKSGGVWRLVFEAGGSVNQPNIVVSQSASGQQVQSGIRFQQDGASDEIDKDGIAIARVSGEWWSDEPDGTIGNDYDIRCVSLITGTWDFQGAAVGTWINIGTGRNWWMLRTFGKEAEGVGSDNTKGNFEIRDSATQTVQASFTLDVTATITA